MKTLFDEIKAAGIPFASHETDLYFPVTEASRAILERHPLQKSIAQTFTNQVEGGRWFDVPFAYLPAWEAKQAKAYQPKTGERCGCRRGVQRDNCPRCEGTGEVVEFAAIRARKVTQ